MTRTELALWIIIITLGLTFGSLLAWRDPGGTAITAGLVVLLVWLCPDRRRV